jgi:TolB protein
MWKPRASRGVSRVGRSLIAVLVSSGAAISVCGADEPLAVTLTGSLQNPAFSPDGSRILLTRFTSSYNVGPSELWVFDAASGLNALLTWAPDSDSVNLPGSAWSPATGRIVFSSDRVQREEIWTIASTGGTPTQVTSRAGSADSLEPSFSPDGEWIVFETRTAAGGRGSLWKVRSDGSQLERLTDGAGGGFEDREPNWSPRGDWIVFQRRISGGHWDLYALRPGGAGPWRWTSGPGDDTDPSFSPDGRWVVYSSDEGLALPEIFVIPEGGGARLRATTSPGRYDGAPSWSPDGRWIAFESSVGAPDGSSTHLRITPSPTRVFSDGFETGDLSRWFSVAGRPRG